MKFVRETNFLLKTLKQLELQTKERLWLPLTREMEEHSTMLLFGMTNELPRWCTNTLRKTMEMLIPIDKYVDSQ